MASGFNKDDPLFGTIDLDDEYITDSWLLEKYVGNQLWTWGWSGAGALGVGGNYTQYYSSPVQVGALTTWKQVSAHGVLRFELHTAAVKTDGTLWTWGINNYGQLGNGNLAYYSSPIQVGALTTWKSVYAGPWMTAAITSDGKLYTWGLNNQSQLGIGAIPSATVYYSSPVQVGALTNWKYVVTEGGTGVRAVTFAIKTDGTLWAWGNNGNGLMGLGTASATLYYSSPIQVGALTNWKEVSTNGFAVAAIKTDGTLWAWGVNTAGQLGNNNIVNYSSPIQIGALTNWKHIAFTQWTTTSIRAIKTDGTLWAWGSNTNGQLGNNNIVSYSSPIQIGALTNWKSLPPNQGQGAIKTDGTLWTWGQNLYGSLGVNNAVYYSSPVQVGSLTNWKQISNGFFHTGGITFTDLT